MEGVCRERNAGVWTQFAEGTYQDKAPLFTGTPNEQGSGVDFASAGGGATSSGPESRFWGAVTGTLALPGLHSRDR